MDKRKVIETAKRKIRTFCKRNGLELNTEMLKVPVEGVEEYLIKRGYPFEDNDLHISKDEILRDLDGDSAYVMPFDEATKKPVIIYDAEKMQEEDFKGQVQIIIHEYLHYADVKKIKFGYANDTELEAEVEAISILVALHAGKDFYDGLDKLCISFNPEKEPDEERRAFLRLVKRSMFKMDFSNAEKRLKAVA